MSKYRENMYTFLLILYIFSLPIKNYYPYTILLKQGLDAEKTAKKRHLVPAVD